MGVVNQVVVLGVVNERVLVVVVAQLVVGVGAQNELAVLEVVDLLLVVAVVT